MSALNALAGAIGDVIPLQAYRRIIPRELVGFVYHLVSEQAGPHIRHLYSGKKPEMFEQDLSRNLYKLWNRMSSGSYFPPPVKQVAIPKATGGTRMLGVPTVADRVAQATVKRIIEPILDPVFHTDSYGYRPGRSAKQAIAVTRQRCWQFDWVVEFDIKAAFDQIESGHTRGKVVVEVDG